MRCQVTITITRTIPLRSSYVIISWTIVCIFCGAWHVPRNPQGSDILFPYRSPLPDPSLTPPNIPKRTRNRPETDPNGPKRTRNGLEMDRNQALGVGQTAGGLSGWGGGVGGCKGKRKSVSQGKKVKLPGYPGKIAGISRQFKCPNSLRTSMCSILSP